MTTNQIYQLLNSITSGVTGSGAISVIDTASFISYGKTVLSGSTENFYQQLADRIGNTIVLYEDLKEQNLVNKMGILQFGAILQTIEVRHIGEAEENNSWMLDSSSPNKNVAVNPFEVIKQDKTDLLVQYFSKRATWEHDKLIWDYQLRDAFTDEATFGAFVEMIFQDMYNSMTLAKNDLQHGVISASIASCINAKSTKPMMARNLLDEYNTITNAGLTVATAMVNKEFLAFCANEILLATKRIKDVSRLYNELSCDKWVDEPQVRVLTSYSTASDSYLASNTYHKELIALPNYKEVNYWQGTGTDGSFTNVSKVHTKVYAGDADTEGTEVEKSGIIAYVADPRRTGYMFDRVRTKSIYNPASECTAYFHKADEGFYINRARDGIVFYIEEV